MQLIGLAQPLQYMNIYHKPVSEKEKSERIKKVFLFLKTDNAKKRKKYHTDTL